MDGEIRSVPGAGRSRRGRALIASDQVAGVVLAAGLSTRMGRNKLLLELGGEPVVARAVRGARDAGLDPVLLVVGHEAERVRSAIADGPWTLRQMTASLGVGTAGSVRPSAASRSSGVDVAMAQ